MIRNALAGLRWIGDFLAPWKAFGPTWRHYLQTIPAGAFWLFMAALIATNAGSFVAGRVVQHSIDAHGGYVRAPLPHTSTVSIGGAVPASASLVPYLVRTHDQGSGNSCTDQTESTMQEIWLREYGRKSVAFSGTWLWAQITVGGGGITYPDLFNRAESVGNAPYSLFPFDQGWTYPYSNQYGAAYAAARGYRVASWQSIGTYDDASMKAAIARGLPIAVAFPVYSSFMTASGYVTRQSGFFEFYHSVTGVGFSPAGLVVQNSWGPYWGDNGRVTLSWDFVHQYTIAVVVAYPDVGPYAFHPKPKPHFPAKVYEQYRTEHHLKPIPYKDGHGHLTWAAHLWAQSDWRHIGGIVRNEQWNPRGPHGRDGFERDSYQSKDLLFWPRHKNYVALWLGHKWLR